MPRFSPNSLCLGFTSSHEFPFPSSCGHRTSAHECHSWWPSTSSFPALGYYSPSQPKSLEQYPNASKITPGLLGPALNVLYNLPPAFPCFRPARHPPIRPQRQLSYQRPTSGLASPPRCLAPRFRVCPSFYQINARLDKTPPGCPPWALCPPGRCAYNQPSSSLERGPMSSRCLYNVKLGDYDALLRI